MGGIADPDTTLRLDRPELRVTHRPRARGRPAVDTEQIATALRLMVGGDTEVSRYRDPTINEDYFVQLRLSEKDRGDLDDDLAAVRLAAGASRPARPTWCASTTS